MPIRAFITETAPARGPQARDDPPIAAVPDWEALVQPSPEQVFDQAAQW